MFSYPQGLVKKARARIRAIVRQELPFIPDADITVDGPDINPGVVYVFVLRFFPWKEEKRGVGWHVSQRFHLWEAYFPWRIRRWCRALAEYDDCRGRLQ